MKDFILIILAVIGIYCAFRYLSLLYAFRKITKEVREVRQDLTQNQILHLPLPNRHLAGLIGEFNNTLEEIQKERQKYEKREKEFQKQIENISHDLRTPLTVILGYLKYVKNKEYVVQDKELREILDIIELKGETMKNLVAQFYEFSRLNGGDYTLKPDKVDMSRILRESLLGNCQILEGTNLEVNINIPEYPVWVMGDGAALERIFLNLLQNAGRYARAHLNIRMSETEKDVSVSFANDAEELSQETVSHLFDRFYIQDDSRNQGGTGLGLTVAKILAEEMGGTLEARLNEDGSGPEQKSKSVISFELRMPVINKKRTEM